jgi:pimeloyl-ACP methyl ester carboxylesterase
MSAMTAKVREQATLLGPRKSLVSIIANAAVNGGSPASAADRPAIVILNAGIIHRVGPNRMFVGLSRMLAATGHLVVRFDLSGIGDSEPRVDGLAPLDAALADIREVLDSLQATRQIDRVILVGLCSGADQAVIYGGSDPRVVGVVLIDPSIPRTFRYYVHHYGGRLFRLSSWLNFTSGRHPIWRQLKRSISSESPQPAEEHKSDLQTPQVRAYLENTYANVVAAGIDILGVFTGDREQQHNYREQLIDAFPKVPFGARLQLDYFAHTDHTFSAAADRESLLRLIVEWVAQRPRRVVPGATVARADSPAP